MNLFPTSGDVITARDASKLSSGVPFSMAPSRTGARKEDISLYSEFMAQPKLSG